MATLARQTGTITTATSTVVIAVPDQPNVGLALSGTHAGINLTFEVSMDGTNWDGVSGARLATGAVEATSGVITTNATRLWTFYVGPAAFFRVRATAWTSGVGSVTLLASNEGVIPYLQAVLGTSTAGIGTVQIGTTSGSASASAATSTVTGVAGSATSVALKALNANRKGLLLFNDSTANLYVNYGATASIASGGYTVKIPGGGTGYYELPVPVYTGAVNGIWDAAAGFVNVTELT